MTYRQLDVCITTHWPLPVTNDLPIDRLPPDHCVGIILRLAHLFEEHGYGTDGDDVQHSHFFLAEFWMAMILNGAAVHRNYSGEDIGQTM